MVPTEGRCSDCSSITELTDVLLGLQARGRVYRAKLAQPGPQGGGSHLRQTQGSQGENGSIRCMCCVSCPLPTHALPEGEQTREGVIYSEIASVGLPWWLSGKESTCQCRRHRLDP